MRGLKLDVDYEELQERTVAPCMGAWIETPALLARMPLFPVAPCMGAWIETRIASLICATNEVAPCMGAWIETLLSLGSLAFSPVAPCMGAWIETLSDNSLYQTFLSHPVWVRGLKHKQNGNLR